MCAARMARKNRQQAGAPPAPTSAMEKARFMMEAGDVRRARQYALEALSSGSEGDKEQARALLERIRPDRTAMLTVGVVLLMIVIAAWLAILRTR